MYAFDHIILLLIYLLMGLLLLMMMEMLNNFYLWAYLYDLYFRKWSMGGLLTTGSA